MKVMVDVIVKVNIKVRRYLYKRKSVNTAGYDRYLVEDFNRKVHLL